MLHSTLTVCNKDCLTLVIWISNDNVTLNVLDGVQK